jgi:hypothetical protein
MTRGLGIVGYRYVIGGVLVKRQRHQTRRGACIMMQPKPLNRADLPFNRSDLPFKILVNRPDDGR